MTSPAATITKDMLRTFKSIEVGLMIGIGTGVPSDEDNIRLGDSIVSSANKSYGGVAK